MNRTEIIAKFREENPEITANVVSDAILKTWLQVGDKEVGCKARIIVDTEELTAVEDQSAYDLTSLIDKFFDVDEIPGGGISVVDSNGNERRLNKRSKSELDRLRPSWRTASSGIPKDYFRRGKNFYLVPAPNDTIVSINVDFVAIPDPFNNDDITPYNQRLDLEPFHTALVFYLTWRAKAKVAKPEERAQAYVDYNNYVMWMKSHVGGGKYGPISLIPTGVTPLRDDN